MGHVADLDTLRFETRGTEGGVWQEQMGDLVPACVLQAMTVVACDVIELLFHVTKVFVLFSLLLPLAGRM